MHVQHAMGVFASGMHGTVDIETGRIDRVRGCHDLATGEVDLDQAGGGDLLEEHAVGIDQEVILRPGDAGRDVSEHQVVPTVQRHQPIACGEIDSQ